VGWHHRGKVTQTNRPTSEYQTCYRSWCFICTFPALPVYTPFPFIQYPKTLYPHPKLHTHDPPTKKSPEAAPTTTPKAGTHTILPQRYLKLTLPLLHLLRPLIYNPMANKQILLKQILCEIVEFFVFGTQAVGGGDAGDAGHFVHVLGAC